MIDAAGGARAAAIPTVDRGRSLAIVLAKQGHERRADRDWSDALSLYRRALDFDPDCYEAWVGLSASFLALQDVSRAAGCLEVARTISR